MATTTQRAHEKELDTKKRSSASRQFEAALREKTVGQDEAVEALVELYQVFCAGLRREPAVPGANRFRQDAHCRGRCGNCSEAAVP